LLAVALERHTYPPPHVSAAVPGWTRRHHRLVAIPVGAGRQENLATIVGRTGATDATLRKVLMETRQIMQAWGKILRGERPSLSLEITRECPLKCPGCYAYNDAHLGGGLTLRSLNDRTGQALVDGVLEVVDRLKPLHLSIVGGDPLVRYRELEQMVPLLLGRGIHVQIVTSAFRAMSLEWAKLEKLHIVVSIDGLQPEHDVRRAPATYARILKNIVGQKITIHCTVTGQMMKRPGYLEEFLKFWTPREETKKVWFSLFTPQIGDNLPEMLTAAERAQFITEMLDLRKRYPKLHMPEVVIQQFATPPQSPADCVFAQTTETLSADFTTMIRPCQFGGKPDCQSCGCIASMGLASVAAHRLGGVLPVGAIFKASIKIGQSRERRREKARAKHPAQNPLPILPGGEPKIASTGAGRIHS
jgi:MoaA/NifB/PqqE/SkfB family radical SAM enzyme